MEVGTGSRRSPWLARLDRALRSTMILIIVVIFWHLPSRSRARKSRLYLNYRRRSQEELIPCAAQRCNSHRSPPSPIFAANRFWTLESSPKNFFGCSSSDLRPRNSLSRGDSKKLARHRNLSLFAINNKMLCDVMLTYFYLNSYIVWLKSSYSLYWLIDSPFLATHHTIPQRHRYSWLKAPLTFCERKGWREPWSGNSPQ